MQEKLKKMGENVMATFQWIGTHLAGILTISVAVLAFLFSRERSKRLKAETDLELDATKDYVDQSKEKMYEAEKEAKEAGKQSDSSYDDYQSAKRDYDKRGK